MCDDSMHAHEITFWRLARKLRWNEVRGEVTLTFEFVDYRVHTYSKLKMGTPRNSWIERKP